jgi:polysaccharide biosynthesis/export protein
MKTPISRPEHRPFCRRFSTRCAARNLAVAILASCCALGCATVDHHYTAKTLPSELQAVPWQAPCTQDLSQSVAGRRSPQFDYGDEIEVTIATGLNAGDIHRVKTTIARDGTVDLPLLGRISIAGTTIEGARNAVVQACRTEHLSPSALVQISQRRPRQNTITVTGAVQHPGIYTISRQSSDLVAALAVAGGVSRDAGPKIIIQSQAAPKDVGNESADFSPQARSVETALLARDSAPATDRREIQLASAEAPALAREDLKDGDVVTVERRDLPSIVVSGMVQKPGRYSLPIGQEFHVLDAITSARGVEYKVIDKVVVCREVPGRSERALIDVSIRDATHNKDENILLMPGDIVSVEPNVRVLFEDTVNFIGMAIMGAAPIIVR